MTAKDIAQLPPIDRNGQMAIAYKMLGRMRKTLREQLPEREWRVYVAKCLLEGEQEEVTG